MPRFKLGSQGNLAAESFYLLSSNVCTNKHEEHVKKLDFCRLADSLFTNFVRIAHNQIWTKKSKCLTR